MEIIGFANGMNHFVFDLNVWKQVDFVTPRVVVKRELAFVIFVITLEAKEGFVGFEPIVQHKRT